MPKNTNKDNKIEVHLSYLNPTTGKEKQIKRSTGINRYAKPKIYTEQANKLVEVLIELTTKESEIIKIKRIRARQF